MTAMAMGMKELIAKKSAFITNDNSESVNGSSTPLHNEKEYLKEKEKSYRPWSRKYD